MGQATQYWPKFSLCDIVKISTYSSDWTSQSMFGSFKKQFPISKVNLLERLILAQ